jgi:hypothetical protein
MANPFKSKIARPLTDNALAKQVLEAIDQIEHEAKQKKQVQAESLNKARDSITERIGELNHQLTQIDKALAAITGRPTREHVKKERRDLGEIRERVGRWMEGHKGPKFSAGDLQAEFPELEGASVSTCLKPLVESGKIRTDASQGIRRQKYFVDENA